MLRIFFIVFAVCLVLALRPQLAFAQVVVGTPTRAIQSLSPGYCFTDDDPVGGDDAIGIGEINVSPDTEAMTDGTIPARDAVETGTRLLAPSEVHIFDNWQDINDIGDYDIDIAGICIGGVSRTDAVSTNYDDTDPFDDGSIDRTEQTTRTETSPTENYFDDDGFTFVGGSLTTQQIINFSGQVRGNIEATAGASNIVFSLGSAVEIDGLLNLGDANAVSNADLTLAGQIDEVDLRGASNFVLTSTADIGDTRTSSEVYASATLGALRMASAVDAGITLQSGSFTNIDLLNASGINLTNGADGTAIDARNISNGLTFTNTGTLGTVDFSGTVDLRATLDTGSAIGTLTANNVTNPASFISNNGSIERLEIGNSSASEKIDIEIVNSGTISADTNSAFIIEDTNAAGGEIDVHITNNGTISATTSDALDFSTLDGGRLDITNTGSVSTTDSGTNDTINGSGAEGLVFLTNAGAVGNGNNRALNLQNLAGYFRLVNSGSITSNQDAIDLTGASASTATAIEIFNGYNLNASGSPVATTSGSREIRATGSNAILMDNVNGDINISNAGGASIIAETGLAIAASGVTGNISLTNAGSIRARRTTPELFSERAIALTATSGDISFESTAGLIDARDRTVNMETIGGKITFSNAGTISSVQTVNDADATATDNFTVRLNRSGAVDDESTITNSGTIQSSTDHALLVEGLACDADAADSSYCLTNSGILSAGRQFALAASAVSDLKFTNSGAISALDQTIDLTDLSGAIVVDNDLLISATQDFDGLHPDPDATTYTMRMIKETGADATLAFTNSASGIISNAVSNTIMINDFNGGNDNVTFSNSGIITTTEDNAVDLSDSTVSSISNDGIIAAGGNYALLLDGLSGTSMVLSNLGVIMAGTTEVGDAPAAIHGELAASVNAISITNGASSAISSVGNILANSDANSGGTIFLDATVASFTLNNSGSIIAGSEATSTASAVEGNNAIRITDIGANAVSITNAASGSIQALGDTAIYLKGDSADITSFTLTNSGTISADNKLLLLEDIDGAVTRITNSGTLSITDNAADHLINLSEVSADFSMTNSGVIETAGTRAIYVDMNDASLAGNEMVVFTNQSGGRIDADSETVTLLDINEQVNFDNGGSIRATAGASTVNFSGIGNHQVDFNNNAGGTISATGNAAVSLADFEAALNFSNANMATITAADDTIILSPATNNARLDFSNGGTISATAQSADHVLRLTGFGGELAIENLSTGRISSNGTNAIYADHQLADPSLDFDNLGTITSRTGDAVALSGFTDAVNVVNSGTIEVTAGDNAFASWGGNETVFTNSGRIEASGNNAVRFSNFVVDASTPEPQFTNSASGIIRAASGAFHADIGAATGQTYTLTNAGSIIADNGALAVNMSGARAAITNSGVISATASPAILAGASSVIGISGSVSAGGAEPVAIALEGRGSTVNLSDGAIIVGTILPLDTGTDYTDDEKHRVNLTGVANASYYYEFPTEQFRFFLNNVEKTDGAGFSPAITNLQATPLIHAHHAQGTRNIWRQLGRFGGKGGFRSFAFADEMEDERRPGRQFALEGDRNGFVQTFQQSVFDWFEAELILVVQEASFELDENTFTMDKSYQAAGFGFSDLLAIGPFSLSAMALAGIGQTDMSRLVLSNTVSDGRFNLESSFDTIYLDTAYEALFDMRVWGKKGKLTRRNPHRINLEVGLGGSFHSENNDGYSEQDYVSTAGSDLQSSSVGGRLKVEYERLNPYSRKNIRAFLEFEQSISEIGSGTNFSYSVQGAAQSTAVDTDAVTLTSAALGVDYEINNDMTASLSVKGLSGDDDSDENSFSLALKWRF
ncbi:MAG: Uncharacterised protein [Alphaproteobacteria bacterium]|nr:MAG: Uncharacterised protein [Alphaproteobacteria bacterium]